MKAGDLLNDKIRVVPDDPNDINPCYNCVFVHICDTDEPAMLCEDKDGSCDYHFELI